MALKRNADVAGFSEGSSGPSKRPKLYHEVSSQKAPQETLRSSTDVRGPVKRALSLIHEQIGKKHMSRKTGKFQSSQLNTVPVANSIAAASQMPTPVIQTLNKSSSHFVVGQSEQLDSTLERPRDPRLLKTCPRPGHHESCDQGSRIHRDLETTSVQVHADQPETAAGCQDEPNTGACVKPELQPLSKASSKAKLPRTNLAKFVLRESQKPYITELCQKAKLAEDFDDSESGWVSIATAQAQALCNRFSMARLLDDVMKSRRKRDRKIQTAVLHRSGRMELPRADIHKGDMKELGWIIRDMLLDIAKLSWEKQSPDMCWTHGRSKRQCECDKNLPRLPEPVRDHTDRFSVTESSVAALAKHWGLSEYLASLEAEEGSSMESVNKASVAHKAGANGSSTHVLSTKSTNQKLYLASTGSGLSQKDRIHIIHESWHSSLSHRSSVQAS